MKQQCLCEQTPPPFTRHQQRHDPSPASHLSVLAGGFSAAAPTAISYYRLPACVAAAGGFCP